MDSFTIDNIEFERIPLAGRILKKTIINPLANYLPADWIRTWLRDGQSELALANWRDPGGWRSMVISYHGDPENPWDRLLVKSGTIPMALRNRRRLAGALIASLIDTCPNEPAHVLCLGAGPGHIVTDAMMQAEQPARATLVDLSNDAFDYGRQLAAEKDVADQVTFIQGDVREVHEQLDDRVDIVKMIGICEYLSDEQIVAIARALQRLCPPGSSVVFNSISPKHGTDRFFRRVFGLHMNHRTPAQLQDLLRQGGYGDFEVFPEPLGVYHVMVGRMQQTGQDHAAH